MKTRFLACFFAICGAASAAQVYVINSTASAVIVDGTTVGAGLSSTVTTSDSTPYIQAAGHSAVVEVIDGAVVEVDAQDVSVAVPMPVYLAVIMKGFIVGMGFELVGFMIRLFRKLGGGTGMAAE